MSVRLSATNRILKGVLDTLCKIDNSEYLAALSKTEPLIVAVNHINFLEVPILVTHSYPLRLTGFVKSETWSNPLFAFLLNTYRAIPIDREGSYQEAFRQARDAMAAGSFVVIAPEGTRSKNGILGKGKAGVVQLALYTGAPVLPVVHYGGQCIWDNIRHLRRTPFQFKVGSPFRIKFNGRPGRGEREQMLAELMGQMAKLLPEKMRGIYARQAESECRYLEFIDERAGLPAQAAASAADAAGSTPLENNDTHF